MNKKIVLSLALSSVGLLAYFNAQSFSSGAPVGKTGSPGDGVTCSSGGCHVGAQSNLPNQTLAISTNIPSTGWKKDSIYTVNVVITGVNASNATANEYGFQATAEAVIDATKAGTFIAGTGNAVTSNNWVTHRSSALAGNGGTKTQTFKWKAPATDDVDTIMVYAIGNITNNANGDDAGDNLVLGNSVAYGRDTTKMISAVASTKYLSVIAYPNPTQNRISAKLPTNELSASLSVYNFAGQKVLSETVSGTSISFDASNLTEGRYFVQVAGKNVYTFSFVLAK